MSEKYKPSNEEIQRAKDMMTEKEWLTSTNRKDDLSRLSKELREGLHEGKYSLKLEGYILEDLDPRADQSIMHRSSNPAGETARLYGTIDNHDIDIELETGGNYGYLKLRGSIDGMKIGKEVDYEIARKIFSDYTKIANLQNKEIYEQRANDTIIKNKEYRANLKWLNSPEYKLQREKEIEEEEMKKQREYDEEEKKKQKQEEIKESLKDIL